MGTKKVELPLMDPIYSTYHCQGNATAILNTNPSIRNWYLNQVMILSCSDRFLSGYTTPELNVVQSTIFDSPYLERHYFSMQFAKGYINTMIKELLDNEYYVTFGGVDDFYIPGKSWYHKRHFIHDGLICGYDQEKKTYTIYAYDSNWVYKTFAIPQIAFNRGRLAAFRQGVYGRICGLKPLDQQIDFEPHVVLLKLKEYLNNEVPEGSAENLICGICVHDYIFRYVEEMKKGAIPYERMDWRVFRLIWEHKKVMLERLKKMEAELRLDDETSRAYEQIVLEADMMRMLYASHHVRRRDSLLPVIQKKLTSVKEKEQTLLSAFVVKAGGMTSK